MPETQGSDALPGILATIVEAKRAGLSGLASRSAAMEGAAVSAPAPRAFRDALAASEHVALIAECKRRSPGAGDIRPDLDPAELTRAYARAGAAALSVLTDDTFFGGGAEDLVAARQATSIPVLRKDFTIDRLHVLEARAMGADAVLLIVRVLDDSILADLHATARDLGMDVLVEVHERAELDRALRVGADLIGINNRDLSTFRTDLATTARLLEDMPDDVIVVSESGIHTTEDVERLGEAGVDAILVGEALLRAPDPGAAAARLAGVPKRRRVRA